LKKTITFALILFCFFGFTFASKGVFPKFSLRNPFGTTVSLENLLSDKEPLIIAFWSTLCKPCNHQLISLRIYIEDLRHEPEFKVVIICEDDSKSIRQVRSIALREGWSSYYILYDENGNLKNKCGVIDIPEIFLVDSDGYIYFRQIGYNPGDEKVIFKNLEELLEEAKSESDFEAELNNSEKQLITE